MSIRSAYTVLPRSCRPLAASLYGYYLRWWRYGTDTERLVQEAIERESWSLETWRDWQQENLAYILDRAAKRVPYYRTQWEARRRVGDRASIEVLSNWRVLTKDEVRKRPRAFLADDAHPAFMYQETTSGTTGKPLRLWCSRGMQQAWYALFEARWRRWYGLNFHDRWGMFGGQLVVPFQQKVPPFWVWNHGLNQLYFSAAHIRLDWTEEYVDAIRRYSLVYLYGYASAIHQLALNMLQKGLRLNLSAVITDAEPLYEFQKGAISEAFGCSVFDTYGLAEMVTAASVCQSGSRHLWADAGVVEVLNDEDQPSMGEGRIVATGFLNTAMPLIRYDTLDSAGPISYAPCPCGRTLPQLPSLYGRKDDAIITGDGRRVFLLDIIFEPTFHIKEGQIVQEALDDFLVRVVPAPGWSQKDAEAIVAALHQRLGSVRVVVATVATIERTWRGKLRVVISKLPHSDRGIA